MLSSLSVQRMQLSDDPDDWVWVRWYWCQPGARLLDTWTAFRAPIWETDRGDERPGPQIYLEGGKFRRNLTSTAPGLAPHGLPEWFENGLPLDARDTDDAQQLCGGELWDTQADLSCTVLLESPAPVMAMGGGVAIGGQTRMGGGPLTRMTGGLSVGGSALVDVALMAMGGGLALGGSMPSPAVGNVAMAGGVAVGGSMPSPDVGNVAMEGGVAVGGSMPQRQSGAPSVVGSTEAAGTGSITWTVPGTAADGDMLVAFMTTTSNDDTLTSPGGWTTPWAGIAYGTPSFHATMAYHRITGSPPSTVTFTSGGSPGISGSLMVLRRAGNPSVGTDFNGTTTPAVGSGITISGYGSLLLMFLAKRPTALDAAAPTGMTLVIADTADFTSVFVEDGMTPGATGDLDSDLGEDADWVTFVHEIPDADPE